MDYARLHGATAGAAVMHTFVGTTKLVFCSGREATMALSVDMDKSFWPAVWHTPVAKYCAGWLSDGSLKISAWPKILHTSTLVLCNDCTQI